MRIVELICAVLCLVLFVNTVGTTATSLARTSLHARRTRAEVERDTFIAESFRNTCHGKGFADLREWQRVCTALFDIQELTYGIYRKGSVAYNNNARNLLYCCWESSRGEITVIDFVNF